MQKYNVDFLDLVIIRSCQLACQGCCTFSDHKKVNGLVDPDEAEESIKFWSQYIDPTRVHLFGGEPLMHPQFMGWARLVRKYWPSHGPLWINTNGYMLDKLFDHIDELFVENSGAVSVTHHTLEEPYSSLVLSNYQKLQDLILAAFQRKFPRETFNWESEPSWDSDHKKFSILKSETTRNNYVMLNITHQHGDFFVPHYKGHGADLAPWHDYTDQTAKVENHAVCHIKNYVQLYHGRLYKCPPRAVLNQTLDTYKLHNNPAWAEYYNNYKSVGLDATPEEIADWFAQQKLAEDTCNMCGFMHSHTHLPAQQHLPKKLFKLKVG
jgi:organic radical activating enzyme